MAQTLIQTLIYTVVLLVTSAPDPRCFSARAVAVIRRQLRALQHYFPQGHLDYDGFLALLNLRPWQTLCNLALCSELPELDYTKLRAPEMPTPPTFPERAAELMRLPGVEARVLQLQKMSRKERRGVYAALMEGDKEDVFAGYAKVASLEDARDMAGIEEESDAQRLLDSAADVRARMFGVFDDFLVVPEEGGNPDTKILFDVDGYEYSFILRSAQFGAPITPDGVKGALVLTDPVTAQTPLWNATKLKNAIAICTRGEVPLMEKARILSGAAATACVVLQLPTDVEPTVHMPGVDPSVTAACSMMVAQDGDDLLEAMREHEARGKPALTGCLRLPTLTQHEIATRHKAQEVRSPEEVLHCLTWAWMRCNGRPPAFAMGSQRQQRLAVRLAQHFRMVDKPTPQLSTEESRRALALFEALGAGASKGSLVPPRMRHEAEEFLGVSAQDEITVEDWRDFMGHLKNRSSSASAFHLQVLSVLGEVAASAKAERGTHRVAVGALEAAYKRVAQDGMVDVTGLEDCTAVLRILGVTLKEPSLGMAIDKADPEGKGKLDMQGFMAMVKHVPTIMLVPTPPPEGVPLVELVRLMLSRPWVHGLPSYVQEELSLWLDSQDRVTIRAKNERLHRVPAIAPLTETVKVVQAEMLEAPLTMITNLISGTDMVPEEQFKEPDE